jgi:hypothetical protein
VLHNMQKRDAEDAPSPEFYPLASADVASSKPSQKAVQNKAAKRKKADTAGADVEPLSQRLAHKRPLSASDEEKKAGRKSSNKQSKARHSAPSAVGEAMNTPALERKQQLCTWSWVICPGQPQYCHMSAAQDMCIYFLHVGLHLSTGDSSGHIEEAVKIIKQGSKKCIPSMTAAELQCDGKGDSDTKQPEARSSQQPSQHSKATNGASRSQRRGLKSNDTAEAGAAASAKEVAEMVDSTAKQEANKISSNSNSSKDKHGKQISSAADEADNSLKEDGGRQVIMAAATAAEKPAAKNKSAMRSGGEKICIKASNKIMPSADIEAPVPAAAAVSQPAESRQQLDKEAVPGLADDDPAPAERAAIAGGVGSGQADRPTAAGSALADVAAQPKRVKKGSKSGLKSGADAKQAALHTAKEMANASAANLVAVEGLAAARASDPGWTEQELLAVPAADQHGDELLAEAAVTTMAAGALDAGVSAFSKLQVCH